MEGGVRCLDPTGSNATAPPPARALPGTQLSPRGTPHSGAKSGPIWGVREPRLHTDGVLEGRPGCEKKYL